ncbi:4'-phosphopantetheinyl transferase family protein [Castellaniella caeni]|uniref:4'-phosphopantetheinyl transferase family protein n=1 Tax=Castellaniella caeni TaxID=266123 RepID=UPI00083097CD|nr:4'-phosphopantetheinyl transferase superfamily protein [Castellaniella caeni]
MSPAPADGSLTRVVALHGLPDARQAQHLRCDLPDAEWRWITRLRQPHDQLRSLLGRALARRLLAQRLNLSPARVPLMAGPHGKPQLAATSGADPAWHFNVAHSGDQVLVAVGPYPMGVDVERCPDTVNAALWRYATGTPNRHQPEGSAESNVSGEQAFCAEWVRREATLKACGLGLLLEPGQLRFAPGPGWQAVLAPTQVAGWHVRLLWDSAAHCAALCLPTPTASWCLTRCSLDAWLDGPR